MMQFRPQLSLIVGPRSFLTYLGKENRFLRDRDNLVISGEKRLRIHLFAIAVLLQR